MSQKPYTSDTNVYKIVSSYNNVMDRFSKYPL
jgi:hypothetical protein